MGLGLASDGLRCGCCCGVRMETGGRSSRGGQIGLNVRTRGHLRSRRVAPGQPRPWIWMCHRCNRDQGDRSLTEWCLCLYDAGDARARRVLETLIGIENYVLGSRR